MRPERIAELRDRCENGGLVEIVPTETGPFALYDPTADRSMNCDTVSLEADYTEMLDEIERLRSELAPAHCCTEVEDARGVTVGLGCSACDWEIITPKASVAYEAHREHVRQILDGIA